MDPVRCHLWHSSLPLNYSPLSRMLADLRPEAIVPLALWMCHESSGLNGEVIECGIFARNIRGPLGPPWAPLGPPGAPWGPLGPLGTTWGPLGALKTALAWLACLLCPALAWSGLGLSCLPCQQQQPAASPAAAKAGHNRQASQAKAGGIYYCNLGSY